MCGVVNHLLNVCKSAICKMEYWQVQLIEEFVAREDEGMNNVSYENEKKLVGVTLYFYMG